jgi:hypothetical protein
VPEETGKDSGEFRIDLERVVVDPDYRRRVLVHLRAEMLAGTSSAPPDERSDPPLVDSIALGPMLGRGRA